MHKRPAPNIGTEFIKSYAEKLDDISPNQKKRYIDTWCENFKLWNQKTLNKS